MRRMGNLSRHLGWLLLAPEPKEEERGRGGALVFLAFGGLFAAFGVLGLFQTPPEFLDALRQWALALALLVQAVLFSASLYERPRAVLVASVFAIAGGGGLVFTLVLS